MMWAQHALNAVLQGHFFDAVQLSQIAQELADYERAELNITDPEVSNSLLSRHMDETGFFSIEVVERALKTWDMELVRWRASDRLQQRYEHPECEFAFILNLDSHWFALRGFGHRRRQWCVPHRQLTQRRFNLNSFFHTAEWVGDTYLSTFLQAVRNAVFII